MTNTEGLDALAALCGSTISAPTTEENAKVCGDVAPVQNNNAQPKQEEQQHQQQTPAIPTNTNTQTQASQNQTNLVQQQQQQQMQQVSQLQQVQLLLARQAAVAQAQQQQQQQQQQQVQQQFNPQLVQQLQSLLASQQVDNNNAIQVQAQHALQAIAAQQQQQQLSAVALASLAASGQVLPTATLSSDLTTLPQVTTTFDLQQQMKMPSPSTLAMPPPPSKLVPSLTLSGNTKKSKKKKGSSPPIEDIITEWEDKKQAKRAANRLSAHLSRKRKKMFIEELKEENVELRRKELILRSIPDLIVVFDSSGCISFVSHSVTRFLDYKVEELENTSFWEHLTEESMRLIKSAFMDALAIKRNPSQDSTPLANGESMAVTLLHKNNGGGEAQRGLKVTLKGVVHFSTDSPECVCSIRPESTSSREANKKTKPAIKESSSAAAAQNQQKGVAALADGSVAPTHQVSDIDSEKS